MALTTTQRQQLKAALESSADPVVVAALAIRDDVTLTTWCNTAASPAQKAWKTAMAPVDVDEATPWTGFDALSAGKRESWRQFLVYARNFSKNAIRKWVTDIWGNATANSSAEAILQAAAENMTNGEVVFAASGNTKTTGTVSALDRAVVGPFSLDEISGALNGAPVSFR